MDKKKGKIRTAISVVKRATKWALFKPLIKVSIITKEDKEFIENANRFLEPSAIKPEYRGKIKTKIEDGK